MSILPYGAAGGSAGYPGVISDGSGGLVIDKALTVGGAGSATDANYCNLAGNLVIQSFQGDYLGNSGPLDLIQDADLTGRDPESVLSVTRSLARHGHPVIFPALAVYTFETEIAQLPPLDEPVIQTGMNIQGVGAIINVAGGLGLGGNIAPIDGGLSTPGAVTSGPSTAVGTGATPSVTAKKLAGQTGYLLNCVDDSNALKASIAVDGEFLTTDDVIAFGTMNCHGGFAAWNHAIPAVQPAITGALSAVADPAVKTILTSLIAAVVGCGLASDATT